VCAGGGQQPGCCNFKPFVQPIKTVKPGARPVRGYVKAFRFCALRAAVARLLHARHAPPRGGGGGCYTIYRYVVLPVRLYYRYLPRVPVVLAFAPRRRRRARSAATRRAAAATAAHYTVIGPAARRARLRLAMLLHSAAGGSCAA
jgi:hypothetical protein